MPLEPNGMAAQQDLVDLLRESGDLDEARRRLAHANGLMVRLRAGGAAADGR